MRRADLRAVCEGCRERISLQLDGELSELEQALLQAHLDRCAACRAYAQVVRGMTRLLRSAPLEPAAAFSIAPRRRAGLFARVQATAAAALAFGAVGLGAQLVALNPSQGLGGDATVPYPTHAELDEEQALVTTAVATPRAPAASTDTVR